MNNFKMFCITLEIVTHLLSGLIVVGISIPSFISKNLININIEYFCLFFIIMLIFSHPKVFSYLTNLVNRVLNQPHLDFEIKYSSVLLIIIMNIINYFLLGFAFAPSYLGKIFDFFKAGVGLWDMRYWIGVTLYSIIGGLILRFIVLEPILS